MTMENITPRVDARPESSVSRQDLYDMIRRQIEHEDSLINQRLNWLLLSQAFLLTASTTILTREMSAQSFLKPAHVPVLLSAITLIGIVLSSFSLMGIRAAQDSLKNLRETWYSPYDTEEARQALDEGFPQITWVGKRWKAINTAKGTPILIIVVWLTIAFLSAPHSVISWYVALGELIFAVLVLWVAYRT